MINFSLPYLQLTILLLFNEESIQLFLLNHLLFKTNLMDFQREVGIVPQQHLKIIDYDKCIEKKIVLSLRKNTSKDVSYQLVWSPNPTSFSLFIQVYLLNNSKMMPPLLRNASTLQDHCKLDFPSKIIF